MPDHFCAIYFSELSQNSRILNNSAILEQDSRIRRLELGKNQVIYRFMPKVEILLGKNTDNQVSFAQFYKGLPFTQVKKADFPQDYC